MAAYNIPSPKSLDISSGNLAEKWKLWKCTWTNYELATKVAKEDDEIRVATLLAIIGEETVRVYNNLEWDDPADNKKIKKVLEKLEAYFLPRKNIRFERYRFNQRVQADGESIDTFITSLRDLSIACEFGLERDSLICDRVVQGIRDDRARERLLRETELSLQQAANIVRSSEIAQAQAKQMAADDDVNFFKRGLHPRSTSDSGDLGPSSYSKRKGNNRPEAECNYCGRKHPRGKTNCPASGQTCRYCGKEGHFEKKCYAKAKPQVHHVDDEFYVLTMQQSSKEKAIITMKVNKRVDVQFQMDTGATCNVLPWKDYVLVTDDKSGKLIKPVNAFITLYDKSRKKVAGEVKLRLERNGAAHNIVFLVLKAEVVPILGLSSCKGMGLISINDSDKEIQFKSQDKPGGTNSTNKVSEEIECATADHEFWPTENNSKLKDPILLEYQDVFEGLGCLPGPYTIQIDESITPVVHPPRRIPVALRETLRQELLQMTEQEIIAPVTEPTAWVNSMVVIKKKNNAIRICLDPRELNRAVKRSHYPMPTVEEVATNLSNVKVFTVLDARSGFWQVKLDEASSHLTTFNTPYGRFRWKRLPFGIKSAPEEWQRRMIETIEGLSGVHVIHDDFLVTGSGETLKEATQDHDKNLKGLLQRARERGLKMNGDKIKLRRQDVPYMGHILTADGLKPDPAKVEAILKMPKPRDQPDVKRLLGMVQYLGKFLPSLSDVTQPLRELERQDVVWQWEARHDTAWEKIKNLIANAPVLRYFDPELEVTIQADACKDGLGAALLQEGQPVSYTSRALTTTEQNYAQIEKELLAVVFACERFDQYVYGRQINVESDHKPLEMISKKPIADTPKRLQRMLLRLQRYDIKVVYKKGSEMFLADTLSRAYLTNSQPEDADSVLDDFEVNMTEHIPINDNRLEEIRAVTAKDQSMQLLSTTIQDGWPNKRENVAKEIQPYFNNRDEFTIQNGLLFKGNRIIIPPSLRREMVKKIHYSHIGIEGCLRRAREAFYWPNMNGQIKDHISHCDICNAHRPTQQQEPLIQHDTPTRPWAKVGIDLFDFDRQTYAIMVDYYSNFWEVKSLGESASGIKVINWCREQFGRHGIPSTVMSDNGSQFACEEFQTFARTYGFEHVTSSPRYPQSNGRVEKAVGTCKNLMTKAKAAKRDIYLVILDWRNTPTEGLQTSPTQRLMGRRTRTLIPVHTSLLEPAGGSKHIHESLKQAKIKQAKYYNRKSKPLPELKPDRIIRMRRPGEKVWSKGKVICQAGIRSYKVEVNGRQYRRNRRQLRAEPEQPEQPDPDYSTDAEQPPNNGQERPVQPPDATDSRPMDGPTATIAAENIQTQPLRRSSRPTKCPLSLKDFVTD